MRPTILIIVQIAFLSNVASGDVYVYPVTPASPEWKMLTMEQRISSQQIPMEQLEEMTTDELYESFLSLPSRIRILESPIIKEGFDSIRAHYNVVAELMKRADIRQVTVQRYSSYHIDGNNNTDFDYQFRIDCTAILLSQDEIQSQLTLPEQKSVITQALSIFRANTSANHSSYWEIPTLALIGKVLYTADYPAFMQICNQHPEIETMLHDGVLYEIPDLFEAKDLISIATDFIHE